VDSPTASRSRASDDGLVAFEFPVAAIGLGRPPHPCPLADALGPNVAALGEFLEFPDRSLAVAVQFRGEFVRGYGFGWTADCGEGGERRGVRDARGTHRSAVGNGPS
jgi:hypothetical protein